MFKRFIMSSTLSLVMCGAAWAANSGPATPLAPKATADFERVYLDAIAPDRRADALNTLFDKDDLIAALDGLKAHGLNPQDYHYQKLSANGVTGAEMSRYALDAWMSAASHIAFGKLSPTSVEPDWTAKGRQADLVAHLSDAIADGSIATSLDRLAPQHAAYQSLRTELIARLSRVQDRNIVIPAGETLKLGMSSPRVGLVQTRLGIDVTNDFDVATEDATIAFQSLNGLDADGVIGPATLRVLNRGESQAIDQLVVNLERWRWLPDDLGRRHVRVNIADFSVQAWKDGAIDRVHGAIVGKPFRKTPVFSDSIRYLVLNPWWETPASLARRDKLPAFQKDPTTVSRLGFQVLDRQGQVVDATKIDWKAVPAGTMPYRIRQAPGDLNALGQVKIMFPNAHNVYLHDTPNRGLFAQRQRAFSSGCIRTQVPLDLSEWLLSETEGWDRARINSAIQSGRETRANLSVSVPVHILYMTVVSDPTGVRFVDDIYDRDAAVLVGLRKPFAAKAAR